MLEGRDGSICKMGVGSVQAQMGVHDQLRLLGMALCRED
jgi:hypothetical protein